MPTHMFVWDPTPEPEQPDEDDPVVRQLRADALELERARDFLEYHEHDLAATIIRKELTRTLGLIGKWKAVHTARLPL